MSSDLFFLFLILLNLYLDEQTIPEKTAKPHYLISPFLEVTVKGAVAKPGVYQVAKGTSLGEVIRMAEPLDNANLRNISLNSTVTRRRTLEIKEIKR